jgi:aminoglycoside phosphotransferase
MLMPALEPLHPEPQADWEPCLHPDTVLRALQQQFTRIPVGDRDSWEQARMIEALFHPKRYLRVLYALMPDASTPSTRYWPEGQLVYLHAPVRVPMSGRGRVVDVEGVSVEAYAFPNDRRLRGIRRFARRQTCARMWERWAADGPNPTASLDGASLQRLLIRYVPEQKWTARLRAEWREPGGKPVKRRIAVQAAAPSRVAALVARHNFLNFNSHRDPNGFTIPAVVGWEPHHGLFAMDWARGLSLLDALKAGDVQDILGEVARRLHRFHVLEVPALPTLDVADVTRRASAALADLRNAAPDLQAELAGLARTFRRAASRISVDQRVTLHNDFHWKQLSIRNGRFALLDLERMCIGDPLIDVAGFATQLEMLGDRPEMKVAATTACHWRHVFLEEWSRRASPAPDPTRMAVYSALARLDLARGMMRHLRPGWRSLAARCVEAAARDLKGFGE